jgi:hypothetical protein
MKHRISNSCSTPRQSMRFGMKISFSKARSPYTIVTVTTLGTIIEISQYNAPRRTARFGMKTSEGAQSLHYRYGDYARNIQP